MKVLVDANGKALLTADGKLATDDCPGNCCAACPSTVTITLSGIAPCQPCLDFLGASFIAVDVSAINSTFTLTPDPSNGNDIIVDNNVIGQVCFFSATVPNAFLLQTFDDPSGDCAGAPLDPVYRDGFISLEGLGVEGLTAPSAPELKWSLQVDGASFSHDAVWFLSLFPSLSTTVHNLDGLVEAAQEGIPTTCDTFYGDPPSPSSGNILVGTAGTAVFS